MRITAGAALAGSFANPAGVSKTSRADKQEQQSAAQVLECILPGPSELRAYMLLALVGLLATRIFDGKGMRQSLFAALYKIAAVLSVTAV